MSSEARRPERAFFFRGGDLLVPLSPEGWE